MYAVERSITESMYSTLVTKTSVAKAGIWYVEFDYGGTIVFGCMNKSHGPMLLVKDHLICAEKEAADKCNFKVSKDLLARLQWKSPKVQYRKLNFPMLCPEHQTCSVTQYAVNPTHRVEMYTSPQKFGQIYIKCSAMMSEGVWCRYTQNFDIDDVNFARCYNVRSYEVWDCDAEDKAKMRNISKLFVVIVSSNRQKVAAQKIQDPLKAAFQFHQDGYTVSTKILF